MSRIVIQAENISKIYRIGSEEEVHDSLISAVLDLVKRPVSNLRRLRELATFEKRISESPDTLWALKDVSFEVRKGEILGVIGRNGAGKSTLLKILAGITEPTGGRAVVRGRIGSLLEVGTGFHPELTGRENVYLNGTILGMRKKEVDRQFDQIVDFSGVRKFVDTPIKRYSSGMKVRLAFAVAAHLNPEILLIDEVLAVGDASFQRKCLGKMEGITKEGRTVLFVSHNMSAVQKLCSRVMLFQDGAIVRQGDVRETVAYYLSDDFSGQEGEAEENIGEKPRLKGLGEQVRIIGCKLFDAVGNEKYRLPFGQDFSVQVDCRGLSDFANFSIIIGINDSVAGVRITTAMSDEAGKVASVKKGQTVRGRLHFENFLLKPGRYSVTIAIVGMKGHIDHLANVKSFEITTLLDNLSKVPNEKSGLMHVLPNWDIQCLDHTKIY